MTEFEGNNPKQLKDFLVKFRMLIDEYHANIYLMDELFVGVRIIENEIIKKLNKE